MRIANHPQISTRAGLRPAYVEVNLSRLGENYRAIRQHVGKAAVMPILKANAYGHGLIEVANYLAGIGVERFGVAFLEEGILLREAGIKLPILVLGGILGSQVPLFLEHDLTLTASSIDKLDQIEQAAEAMGVKAKVHYYSAEPFLEASLNRKHIEIEGIFSHFANADAADLTSARLQMERFNEVLKFYEDRSIETPVRHMANSGAVLQLPEAHLDMVRPGILLFGVYPSEEAQKSVSIRPALSWKTRVVYFKVVKPGHPVSYGSTWQSETETRVVTVPVGYGDGYFRAMSNKAEVIIRGKRYPVVGRVCMDQFMVNIGWDSAYNGDEVVLIGEEGESAITTEDLAEWAGTIPYEILTNINTRVPRVYVEEE
jgi:alanine racemase